MSNYTCTYTFNIDDIENAGGCQRTICFFSLAHAQHRQNTLTQNHFFFMFISSLRVKLPITKKIENNIFEGMTYRFYILLLF